MNGEVVDTAETASSPTSAVPAVAITLSFVVPRMVILGSRLVQLEPSN